MDTSQGRNRSARRPSVALVAALVLVGCKGTKARSAKGALAACGLAYRLPEGWTAADPSPQPPYAFPAIGPGVANAELEAPDGMQVIVQCVARWTKATTTTCDGGTTAVGFDDYVQRRHEFFAAGPLASEAGRAEVPLGDGGTLALTTAHLARGLVDGTEAKVGFGAARVGELHVVVRASAPPAAFDQPGLTALIGSLRPR